jgi:hypothetical protein
MTFRTFIDDAGMAFDFQSFFDPKLELRFKDLNAVRS